MPVPLLIDADTHLSEPPDLWTSAVPPSRREQVPHVRREAGGPDTWHVGEHSWLPVGQFAFAGTDFAWGEGRFPERFEDLLPATWDPEKRLAMMDEQGIHAQVVYPNVVGFAMGYFEDFGREAKLECIRIYNDWIADWARKGQGRLYPLGTLPLFDLNETLREADRAAAAGQRGILFPQHPRDFGLPHINERHWDPLWHFCEDAGLSVNFHVGVGLVEERRTPIWSGYDHRSAMVLRLTMLFAENIGGLANLLFSGILRRFPKLNFVSVESGIGYVPYLLEACDWQYEGGRCWEGDPSFDLRPSEYFRRQVFITYWFERLGPQVLLDWIGADRVMLETDFPHPTSLAHAAGQRGQQLHELIDEATSFLAPADKAKVMWENAAKLYRIPAPATVPS